VPKEKYMITGTFVPTEAPEDQIVEAKLEQVPKTHETALEVLNLCAEAKFHVQGTKSVIVWHSPPPPYKTSVFQQDAGKRFGISPKDAMRVAQSLYEAGKITYHRTDTTNLSSEFKGKTKAYIVGKYGNEYLSDKMKKFTGVDSPKDEKKKKKGKKGEQAAHEAIRPTDVNVFALPADKFDSKARLIYRMIWVRAVASLMAKEKCRRYSVQIMLSNSEKYWFIATYMVTLFPGFKILTNADKEVEDPEEKKKNSCIPDLGDGRELSYVEILSRQTFSEPPKRYTESSLVKDLENKGIGRPSTYASIINTIQFRNYVKKQKSKTETKDCLHDILKNGKIKSKIAKTKFGDNKQRLFPTDLGVRVTAFLLDTLNYMMDYKFTSNLETQLDEIAEGDIEWKGCVGGVHHTLEDLMGKVAVPVVSDEQKAKYKQNKTDRTLGKHEGHQVEYFNGKFGPFVKYRGKCYSLLDKSKTDVSMVTLADGVEAINGKKALVSHETEWDNRPGSLQIAKGPYGFYLKFVPKKGKSRKTDNFFLPKAMRDDEAAVSCLTLEECLKSAQNARDFRNNGPKKYKKK
jgi:DNA topoisomerase-1